MKYPLFLKQNTFAIFYREPEILIFGVYLLFL